MKRLFALIKGLSEVVDVKVVKETVTGEEAVLEATGLNVAMGNDARASVQMVREGGVWKVKKESWRSDDTAPPTPPRTCPELLADLKGAAAGPRARAVSTLGQRTCADVVPELVRLLRDPSPAISTNASGALRMNMQGDPQRYASFLPALVAAKAAAASSESIMVQANLQQALSTLGPPAIPGLVADLQHADRDMRWGAAAGLGMMGPAAREALPALEAAARAEKDGTVHDRMVEAINQVRR